VGRGRAAGDGDPATELGVARGRIADDGDPRADAGGRGRVVVVGDLVTDVVVVPSGPLRAGSDTAAAITVAGGGQAANTAAWLARAGVPVTLVAAVGDDRAGRERVDELSALGVRCAVRAHPGVRTGSVVVLASPSERTMITDRGAALLLSADDVATAIGDAADAVHLHLSGYPLLDSRSRPGGLAALSAARDRGLRVSVDAASAAPLREAGAPAFLSWVRRADLLLCNADEAEVLAGPGSPSDQGRILCRSVPHVVVKRGVDGASWCGPDGVEVVTPAVPVPVIDPTGAGDAFAAGLIAAWVRGATPAEALAAGATQGAAAVSHPGARPPPR
jgi:sugar/nucleoside kinase (ribokinase family)